MKYIIELLARNIVNLEEINAFIMTFLDLDPEEYPPEIQNWMDTQLQSYLINHYDKVKLVKKFNKNDPDWFKKGVEEGTLVEVELTHPELKREINHCIDYFASMEDSELKKIYKIPFKIAVKKSEDWTKELHRKAPLDIDKAGEAVVRSYPKGVTWKRLLTTEALEREGSPSRMSHCVGGKTFLKKLKNNKAEFYSLRDKNDHPQCTIEVERNRIEQMKGFDDGPVKREFIEYCKDFIDKPIKHKKYSLVNDLDLIGMIKIEDKEYDVYDLPDNLTIEYNLFLRNTGVVSLPKNLTVKGSLDLTKCIHLKSLPKNLSVGVNLDLEDCTSLEYLTENLTVHNLNLWNCRSLKELPDTLKVKECIDLTGCASLKYIPDNLTLKYLNLSNCTSLEHLPENLTIRKQLFLMNTKITSLPKNLKVGVNICVNKEFPIEKYPMFIFKIV